VRRRWVDQCVEVPARFDEAVRRQIGHRCAGGTMRSLRALADWVGTRLLALYQEPPMWSAVVTAGGRFGSGSRATSLRTSAGHLLPETVLRRRDNAHVAEVLYGHHTRSFAERWSGNGLEETLVRPDVLREMWRSDRVDPRTNALMQLAWLHDELAEAPAEGAAAPPLTATPT